MNFKNTQHPVLPTLNSLHMGFTTNLDNMSCNFVNKNIFQQHVEVNSNTFEFSLDLYEDESSDYSGDSDTFISCLYDY